ncbi:MAG TPA: PfkB family carbohydrate kinase [Solirubrobacteraceae bacterium]
MAITGVRVAVVGHVEWVRFAQVEHVPAAGEVVHANDPFEEPAGGGAVAAVQLARLAGESLFLTALGDDEHGRRSVVRLRELRVDVRAAFVDAPSRSAVTLVDRTGERTITTFGPRLDPRGEDAGEQWQALEGVDAVYFTAGDVTALRHARASARVLVASPRARGALGQGVALDALVLSDKDEVELGQAGAAQDEARLVVWTEGGRGGRYTDAAGASGRWAAVPAPGPVVDSYGCGDSFVAGLTYGLGAGMEVPDALALAARCGAVCLTGRGPYGRQLGADDL